MKHKLQQLAYLAGKLNLIFSIILAVLVIVAFAGLLFTKEYQLAQGEFFEILRDFVLTAFLSVIVMSVGCILFAALWLLFKMCFICHLLIGYLAKLTLQLKHYRTQGQSCEFFRKTVLKLITPNFASCLKAIEPSHPVIKGCRKYRFYLSLVGIIGTVSLVSSIIMISSQSSWQDLVSTHVLTQNEFMFRVKIASLLWCIGIINVFVYLIIYFYQRWAKNKTEGEVKSAIFEAHMGAFKMRCPRFLNEILMKNADFEPNVVTT